MEKPLFHAIEELQLATAPYHRFVPLERVGRWILQFPSESRYIIATEMVGILNRFMVSKEKIRGIVSTTLDRLDSEIKKLDENLCIQDANFLRISRNGSSQEELLTIFDEELQFKYGISSTDCGGYNLYIYVDDCAFTGNTGKWDVDAYFNGLTAKEEKGFIFYAPLIIHEKQREYIKSSVEKVCHNNGFHFIFCPSVMVKNKLIHQHTMSSICDCYAPLYSDNPFVKAYLQDRDPRIVSSFRPKNVQVTGTMFSSEVNRNVVEQAFLEAGAKLLLSSSNPAPSSRPMGFEKIETIGFGTPLIFWRNIPNNAPLALWWEVHGWTALFERTTN